MIFFYNRRIESFIKSILVKIKNIKSDVENYAGVYEKQFSDYEEWFFKSEDKKKFIQELINFFARKK